MDISSFKFKPATVTVKRGGRVTFANRDEAPHTAQTDLSPGAAGFDTRRLEKRDERTVKLDRTGRFSYFCVYHRFMEGTVEVVE